MSSIKPPNPGDTFVPRELIPPGNYTARCYRMIHLGTVPGSYMGKPNLKNIVYLTFEVPEEQRVFFEENGMQPFSINKKYTLSFKESANLLKMINAWRGPKGPLSKEEKENFDLTKLVGAPCMINVIHDTWEGRTFAKIASISPLPKGLKCPPQINPSFVFGYDPYDQSKFDALGEYWQDEIKKSKEYQHVMNPNHVMTEERPGSTAVQDYDDLPF